jgi:HTH-type transcriptional regulator/antitoxin HigA
MIKNELQYGVTKSQIKQLKDSIVFLENFEGDGELPKPNPEELELGISHIESEISILEEEIEEYLKIKNGEKTPAFPQNISEIGDFVIQLRIAANLTQAELARLVHTKTQVIQRYEATDYATVSIARVNQIVRAINYYQDSRKNNSHADEAAKAS